MREWAGRSVGRGGGDEEVLKMGRVIGKLEGGEGWGGEMGRSWGGGWGGEMGEELRRMGGVGEENGEGEMGRNWGG